MRVEIVKLDKVPRLKRFQEEEHLLMAISDVELLILLRMPKN